MENQITEQDWYNQNVEAYSLIAMEQAVYNLNADDESICTPMSHATWENGQCGSPIIYEDGYRQLIDGNPSILRQIIQMGMD